MRRMVTVAIMAFAALGSARALASGFQDPLDVPALTIATDREILLTGLAVSGDRVVAVGPRGVILYRDIPSGPGLVQAHAPVGSDLTAVTSADPRTLYAVGHDGVVLGSDDRGVSWTKRLDGRAVPKIIADFYAAHPPGDPAIKQQVDRFAAGGADLHLLDAWFEDARHGFVIGSFNLILRTEDGGKSWTPWLDRTDNAAGFHLQAIARIGDAVYMVGEQGLIRVLDVAGQHFVSRPSPYKGTLFGITGAKDAILAYGLRGHAFVSHDQGATWRESRTGASETIGAGCVLPDGRILLGTLPGSLFVSADSGDSFGPVAGGRRHPINALALADGRLALAGSLGLQVEPVP